MHPLILALAALPCVQIETNPYLRTHRAADESLSAGRLDAARTAFERCLVLEPANATVAYGLACVEARAGDTEAALDWLTKAGLWGYADADVVLWDPDLEALRGEPRLAPVLSAMRATADRWRTLPHGNGFARFISTRAERGAARAAVSPRGELAACADSSGAVTLVSARSGRDLRTWAHLESAVLELAFDPSGETLAVLSDDGRLHLGDVLGTAPPSAHAALAPEPAEDCGWAFGVDLRFDPTGERLLVAAPGRGARVWSAERGDASPRLALIRPTCGSGPAWSADGSLLAVSGRHVEGASANDVVFVEAESGRPRERRLTTPGPLAVVALHPDGERVATGHLDGKLRIWDLETGWQLFEHTYVDPIFGGGYVNALAFSPDGRTLACATGTGVVTFFVDVDSGRILWESGFHGGRMGEPFELHWAPDSGSIAYAFVSGGMAVRSLDVRGGFRESRHARGAAPHLGADGLGVSARWGGFAGIDTRAGRTLWMRTLLDRPGYLVHAPSGHFTGDVTSLEGLWIAAGYPSNDPRPLSDHARRLFDPKRYRAFQAGIRLVHPPL